MRHVAWLSGLTLFVAGCATPVTPAAPSVSAELRSPGNEVLARARATQTGGGARVFVEAAGLQPGTYGVHVHATGQCRGPDFTSAGGHWNPTDRRHGMQNPQGPHQGDLPNLVVGADGRGTVAYVIPAAQLAGGAAPMLDGDGAAVVVHAAADDYRTDPSGNSGARIACGILG